MCEHLELWISFLKDFIRNVSTVFRNSNNNVQGEEKRKHLTLKKKKERDIARLIEECMKEPGVYKVLRKKTSQICSKIK